MTQHDWLRYFYSASFCLHQQCSFALVFFGQYVGAPAAPGALLARVAAND